MKNKVKYSIDYTATFKSQWVSVSHNSMSHQESMNHILILLALAPSSARNFYETQNVWSVNPIFYQFFNLQIQKRIGNGFEHYQILRWAFYNGDFWLAHKSETRYYFQLMRIISGASNGLSHLHSNGIIHSNIKASNVMVDADFTPKARFHWLNKVVSDWWIHENL